MRGDRHERKGHSSPATWLLANLNNPGGLRRSIACTKLLNKSSVYWQFLPATDITTTDYSPPPIHLLIWLIILLKQRRVSQSSPPALNLCLNLNRVKSLLKQPASIHCLLIGWRGMNSNFQSFPAHYRVDDKWNLSMQLKKYPMTSNNLQWIVPSHAQLIEWRSILQTIGTKNQKWFRQIPLQQSIRLQTKSCRIS